MVETVERIDAELPYDAFVNGNVLEQGKIIRKECRAEIVVSSYVAKLGDVGTDEDAGLRSVDPERLTRDEVGSGMRRGAERGEAQRKPRRSFVGHARIRRNVGSTFTIARRKGQAAGEVERCAELISSDKVIDPCRRPV